MLLDRYSLKVYQGGLKFVLYVAVKNTLKCDVNFAHSLDKGLYVKLMTDKKVTQGDIDAIRNEMKRIVEADHWITKKVVAKKDAYQYYLKNGELEKAGNIMSLNREAVTLYELLGHYNYFISSMPESTGKIRNFELTFLGNNDFLLGHPLDDSNKVPKYNPQEKIYESFREYDKWIKALDVSYVNDLNKIIANNGIRDFIKRNDIMMNNQFYDIAMQIKESGKKIVLLGGPSSSGKTTSTKKLAMFLSTFGLKPIYLGLDDYFKNRIECPKDEKGEYDFEGIGAIDLELFNTQLQDMLSGKEVSVPTYNFIIGEKEYKNRFIKLQEEDIILIEGLHCLNEELTSKISKVDKLKIYISPFTPLNVDRHNHVSTIDTRLIRRMIRDSWSRGYPPEKTLKMWEKVRNGETKYVFPFTMEADIILNTAFIYEMGVLRVYGEPLLHGIPPESQYFNEARRLLNFIQMFLPISSEYVEKDCILREFIGGSYFEER